MKELDFIELSKLLESRIKNGEIKATVDEIEFYEKLLRPQERILLGRKGIWYLSCNTYPLIPTDLNSLFL